MAFMVFCSDMVFTCCENFASRENAMTSGTSTDTPMLRRRSSCSSRVDCITRDWFSDVPWSMRLYKSPHGTRRSWRPMRDTSLPDWSRSTVSNTLFLRPPSSKYGETARMS
jgi:hypothetical protein